MNNAFAASVIAAGLLVPVAAQAQWSTDAAATLKLADATGDQVQPKIVKTSDGGCYVSWYDNGSINYKNDTWKWDGTAWTRLSPAATAPSSRFRHAMAYDGTRSMTVLFGGSSPAGVFSDTWEWNGTAWTLNAATGPAARDRHVMAFDAAHNRVVLFGGTDSTGTLLGDTWTFDGTSWTQAAPAHSPTARKKTSMAYDSTRSRIVLFGGDDGTNFLADTWEWDGTDWTQVTTANAPSLRSEACMAFDSVNNKVLLFGGIDTSTAILQDTWLYDGANWVQQAPTTLPNARRAAAASISFTAGGLRTVVFGGYSGTFNVAGLYEWSGTNWTSKTNTTTTPSARAYPAMAYDAAHNLTVLFGGVDQGGYDVYLQRLNADGVEQWPHGGIQLCDRSVSSTVDYGLVCDASDNAVVAFNDDRYAPQKITLQKVDPSGNLQWNGILGAQVGDGSTGGSPPKIAYLSDNTFGVIWSNTLTPVSTIVTKVSAAGGVVWTATQTDAAVPARPLQASDVQAADNGGMIALFVRCAGTSCISSSRQLYVQKYDNAGAPQWGATHPVAIMTGTTTIQIATFPPFLSDGAGGAVLGWYETTTNNRNAYLQHVLSNGTLKFVAPVSNVGPTAPAARIRVGAGLDYDRSTGEYYIVSPETDNATQNVNSLFVQKYDNTGTRVWGDTGVTVVASGMMQPNFVQCQAVSGGVICLWQELTSGTTRVVKASRVNNDLTIAWNKFLNSDGTTDKSRLTSALSQSGAVLFAFGWNTFNDPPLHPTHTDIAAGIIQPDGTLGPPVPPTGCSPADLCDGLGNPPGDGFITGTDADFFVVAYNTLQQRGDGSYYADLCDGFGNAGPDGFVTGVDADFFVIQYFLGC